LSSGENRLVNAIGWHTLVGLLALLGFLSLVFGVRNAIRGSCDLRPHYEATCQWVHGTNPYETRGAVYAPYLPQVVFILAPFASSGFGTSRTLWAIANVGFLAISLVLLLHLFRLTANRRRAILLACSILGWSSIRITIGNGQFGLFTLACLLGALVADQREKPMLAGLLLSLALIKWSLSAVFLLYFVLRRRWAVVASLIGFCLAFLVVFSIHIGESPVRVVYSYLRVLAMAAGAKESYTNTSEVTAIGSRYLGVFGYVLVALVLFGYLAWMSVIVGRTKTRKMDQVFLAVCALWTLAAIPHLLYDAVILVLFAAFLLAWEEERGRRIAIGLFVALTFIQWVDVPGVIWKLAGRPMVMQPHFLNGLLFFWFDRAWVLGFVVINLVLTSLLLHSRGGSVREWAA